MSSQVEEPDEEFLGQIDRDWTLRDVKQKFSQPRSICKRAGEKDEYCTGGAFVMACRSFLSGDKDVVECDERYRFPDPALLAGYLVSVNEELKTGRAYQFASDIIESNDDEDFDRAWMKIAEAIGEDLE